MSGFLGLRPLAPPEMDVPSFRPTVVIRAITPSAGPMGTPGAIAGQAAIGALGSVWRTAGIPGPSVGQADSP
jgi:hypothetical protein